MRCAIYARYSSDQQREASIEDQVRICRARAAREGWQIAEVFTDYAVSGSTALRPGYQSLMAAVRDGSVTIVLCESIDRLSRDQEHIAGFFKQAQFADARIVTLAEGEISELHIGLKGTMGALYLKDLADKTRRGLEGRVRQGRSGGGLCYGYRVVSGPMGRDGELERGLRAIEPSEAVVLRRIFERFAVGEGPKAIAGGLNRDGVTGPRGGIWQAGTIRGQAGRDTGILRNRLYVGEIVWNQRRWIKDPTTGRRLARPNGPEAVLREQVPELRIIEDTLWEAVQSRLDRQRAAIEPAPNSGDTRRRFWDQRRPQHMLTGKVVCGSCGTPMASVGRDYLACRVAVASGPCGNRARVRRTPLEAQVLEALGDRLMEPDLVAEFVSEFTAEWNRQVATASASVTGKRRDLEAARRKLDGLIDAIADGLRSPGLQGKLNDLESRCVTLEAEIAAAERGAPVPRLHGNLSEIYRQKVRRLAEALTAEGGPAALEAVRALIERVEVHPPAEPGARPRIELIGALTAMLTTAGVFPAKNDKSPSAVRPEGLLVMCSAEGDAGTGFEPVTFRL